MSRVLLIALVAVVGSLLVVPTSSVAASTATTRDATLRFNYAGATRLARAASTKSRPQRSALVSELRLTGGRSRARVLLQRIRLAAEEGSALIRLGSDESWANPRTLEDHFLRHGGDFGARSAEQYATDASKFLQRAQAEGLPTKIASDGTIRVYDRATNTFGAYSPSGLTKTFFKPTSPGYWARQPGVLVP